LTALSVALAALLCFIWLAQRVDHGETVRFDESVRNTLHSAAHPWLTTLFEAITALGSQAVVTGVSGSAALILFRQGRRAEALLILAAGLSRIYLGVHHASDVIAGYLAAAAWMAGLAALYTRIVNMKR